MHSLSSWSRLETNNSSLIIKAHKTEEKKNFWDTPGVQRRRDECYMKLACMEEEEEGEGWIMAKEICCCRPKLELPLLAIKIRASLPFQGSSSLSISPPHFGQNSPLMAKPTSFFTHWWSLCTPNGTEKPTFLPPSLSVSFSLFSSQS